MKHTQMLKGLLEGCVLKVIGEETCYFGEIVEKLKNSGFDDLSEGTLFPLLIRLEKKGCFVTERRSNPKGPSRKYYTLTPAGKEVLKEFVCEWETLSRTIANVIGKEETNGKQ